MLDAKTISWTELDALTWDQIDGMDWLITPTAVVGQTDGRSVLLTFPVAVEPGVGDSGISINDQSPTTVTSPATNQLQCYMPTRARASADQLVEWSYGGESVSATNNSTFTYPTAPIIGT